MKFALKKIDRFSGDYASFYGVYFSDGTSLFDSFIEENVEKHTVELMDICGRVRNMGSENKAGVHFFKEGESAGSEERLMAIYSPPKGRLRVFCLRISEKIVILGGGGEKPLGMRTWQESRKLTKENEMLENVILVIDAWIRNGQLMISDDGLNFTGKMVIE